MEPRAWNVAQVADHFRNNAALPAQLTRDFAQALEDNLIDGEMLLEHIDTFTLRDDLGVGPLGHRITLMKCIQELREVPRAPQIEPVLQTPTSTTAVSPPSGEHVRAGEVEVREGGRKRRKLDLGAIQNVTQPEQTGQPEQSDGRQQGANHHSVVSSYMTDAKHPVDELFYGQTPVNALIQELPPTGIDVILRPDYLETEQFDTDEGRRWHEDAFITFQEQEHTEGDARYVDRQMRHFFANADATSRIISRRNRNAIAIQLYREKLVVGNKRVSATTIHLDETAEDGAVAVRENAAFLDDPSMSAVQEEQSNDGEWDFLVAKYRQNGSEELPEYGQSDDEDGEMSSTMEREIEEEQEEIREEQKGDVVPDQVGHIIDNQVAAMAEQWKEKLPRKEEKQAWSVWKKMKCSQTLRTHLIESAKRRIQDLNSRLAKYKHEMLHEPWRKEKDLRDQCEVMRVTVEDREDLGWQISVWNRRQEPKHTAAAQTQAHGGAKPYEPSSSSNQRIVVHPNDRISVSPAPQNEDPSMDLDEEHLQTPGGGDADNEQEEQGTHGDDEMEYEEVVSPMADLMMPSPPTILSSPSLLPVTSVQDDDPEGPNHGNQSNANEGDDSDSESLTAMSVLLTQRPKPPKAEPVSQPTSKRAPRASSREEPIEISSSSDESPASRPKSRKAANANAKRVYSANPEDDTAADVESWVMEDLLQRDDRRRVLIKLLWDAGPAWREELKSFVIQERVPGLPDAIRPALIELLADFRTQKKDYVSAEAVYCARLYLAFVFLAPAAMQDQKPDELSNHGWDQEEQLRRFSALLHQFLLRPKLFNASKPKLPRDPPSSAKPKGAVLFVISDDDDDDNDDDEPHMDTPSKKKRKKKDAVLSSKAKQSQDQAAERQSKYKELQQQTSNQLQLEAMIQSDPSRSNVVLNILKEDGQDDIFVDTRIARQLKDHQIKGAQFMWRELTASGSDDAQGCVLAHEQGLGKTVQTIALLIALNEAAHSKNPRVFEQLPPRLRTKEIKKRQLRILVLLPASLLANWRAEFTKWAPEKFPNVWLAESYSAKDHMRMMAQWHHVGGVLIMGYETFRSKIVHKDSDESNEYRMEADVETARYLLDPGPEIVVADEAHRLANRKSQLSIAVSQIKTQSRLGLTGTPMSNDVPEIYALVSFVAPEFLGDYNWFNDRFARPISAGNGRDSTGYQRRTATVKLKALHQQIEPKVDRADITVMQGSLPPKVEFVITLPLTASQHEAYTKYVRHLIGEGRTKDAEQVTIFGYMSVLTLLLNHPIAFKRKLLSPGSAKSKKGRQSRAATDDSDTDGAPQNEDEAGDSIRGSGFSPEVVADITSHISDEISAHLSTKMDVLMKIVRRSVRVEDKVLVFSHSIPTLDYLGELLEASRIKFGRIDGSMSAKKRASVLEEMQAGRLHLMMMSTRAGGVGLNIQVANRVIVLDSSFNPTHEKQAISRSFRMGQNKQVYVYRFSVGGTFETMLYNKQMFKERLNKGVVDKKNTKRIAATDEMKHAIRQPSHVKQADLQASLGKDTILDSIIEEAKQEANKANEGSESSEIMIRNLDTMEVLQEEEQELPLTEEETRLVAMELQEGRNNAVLAKSSRKTGYNVPIPTAGPSHPPAATAPTARNWQRSHTTASQMPNGLPMPSQPRGAQLNSPSRIVSFPYQPPNSTAPPRREPSEQINGLPSIPQRN